jgi:hypothetical protein
MLKATMIKKNNLNKKNVFICNQKKIINADITFYKLIKLTNNEILFSN